MTAPPISPPTAATTARTAPGTTVELSLVGGLHLGGFDFVLTGSAGTAWTFSGRTAVGEALPLGRFAQDLLTGFGLTTDLPAPLAGLTVTDLVATYEATAGSLTVGATVDLPLNGATIATTVGFRLRRGPAGNWSFSATLDVAGLEFDLLVTLGAGGGGDLVLATYQSTGAPGAQDIVALVRALSPEVAALVPQGLTVEIAGIVLAYRAGGAGQVGPAGAGGAFLLAVEVDVSGVPGLTALPLVGPLLPASERIALTALQVVVASAPFPQGLPAKLGSAPLAPVDAGVALSAVFDVSGTPSVLTLPLGAPSGSSAPALPAGPTGGSNPVPPPAPASNSGPASNPAPASNPDGVRWISLEKSFGPVHLNRIGFSYRDQVLLFLIDGALNAAGLTLALDGLGFGSPLDHFAPVFQLRGLGVQYEQGPIEIGGAFLRLTRTEDGVTYDEYDGAAILKTPPFSLTAFGSYAYYKGQPSLFVYAVLDYPIGGPTFFFVTGLAGGFGYNRALHVPGVDTLATFPLVSAATGGADAAPGGAGAAQNGLLGILQQLESTNAIPPSLGDIFFALGIKFTSFEILDGFLLLTVAFGHQLEIDLLGLATLVLPTPEAGNAVPALAEIQMAVKASFLPDQGFLGVAAQLTPASFLFSRDCHLTGGFAFSAWFDGPHAGDFVQTLGGYHPQFPVPAHYPRVPRLGLNWQITKSISIKGGIYYALTASAAMAGGHLQATWQTSKVRAWFDLSADFIVAWKPVHYDAHAHVEFGVQYTFELFGRHTVSLDIGADLHIWGPEFSGTAHLDLKLFSVDMTFGAGAAARPQPLSWDGGDGSFSGSFLPSGSVCGIAVAGGLLNTVDDPTDPAAGPAWVVNPSELALTTNSLIPTKVATIGGVTVPHSGATGFGVAPMDLQAPGLATSQSLSITRDGVGVDADFTVTSIYKPVPTALWGTSVVPTPRGPLFLAGALTGFTLTPARPPAPGATAAIAEEELDFSSTSVPAHEDVPPQPVFAPSGATDAARRDTIRNGITAPVVVAARQQLLGELGIDAALFTAGPSVADLFVLAPQVAA